MRQRLWLIIGIVVTSLAIGLLISGIPGKASDRPLSVRLRSGGATSETPVTATTSRPVSTTTAATPTTTKPATRAPAEVHVRVANASTASLAATNFSAKLATMGYPVLAPVNSNRSDLATTVVVFNPGFEPEARALAQAVGAQQVVSSDPTLACEGQDCGGDVVVFVGRDLAT